MQRVQAFVCCLAVLLLLSWSAAFASELAELTGYVSDPTGARVPRCRIQVTNVETNVSYFGETNDIGLYRISALPIGNYRVIVQKAGFKTVVKQGVELHVQDILSLNFQMEIGTVAESISVEGGAPLINTESAAVSTVVDRNFAENIPLNGRSFQTLIQLTPGVVLTTNSTSDAGQFSVNGQRAASNYWMVDGVSANIGVSPFASVGNGLGGTLGSFSALGGTNSLVSVDAMQEFRIQTSSFAPEFGRTPGGQISIATRSGANQFHGTAFDYLRNDALDANNWFNGFTHTPPLRKAKERQNDFGGTLSGPIVKDNTFFFFSYEGLRLQLPQTTLSTVPDLAARDAATPALQPFLNAFPRPNGPDNIVTGIAQFNSSYSNPASLDAYSLRVDHKLGDKLTLFGRYSYSPSDLANRGSGGNVPLSVIVASRIVTQTGTVGATWLISPTTANDLRFNYSRANGRSDFRSDSFGGAQPLTSLPLPSPFTDRTATFQFQIFSLQGNLLSVGENAANVQRQLNVVDNVSAQEGAHSLKFGVDFRRLFPDRDLFAYAQQAQFLTVPAAGQGNLFASFVKSSNKAALVFHNLGLFAQDTWRVVPNLTLIYGLRWDLDFAPSSRSGPNLPAVTGFNLNDLSQLALAPSGAEPFKTRYQNIAPRIGAAYQISQSPNWETVLRGGFGLFFDLASSEVGNLVQISSYPFLASVRTPGGTFPLSSAIATPPAITADNLKSGTLGAIDPHLHLPYTMEWNAAFEQSLGRQQTATVSYLGAVGRRLIQSAFVLSPNPNLGFADLVSNAATSDYHALQLQFQRQLSHGLQALASYSWAHSIDTASAGSAFGNTANAAVPGLNGNVNRGASDFDIRHTFSMGLTYDIPVPKTNEVFKTILRGWSLQNVVQARSAAPVNVADVLLSTLFNASTQVRPDIVPGQPLYLFGPQFPGGKAFNPAAFTAPPLANGKPLRQGTLGRNTLRGFGAAQWDLGVHRDFPIYESLKLQFRAEMFNVLNHPNFGPPSGAFPISGVFGISSQMLGQSLNGNNPGGGAFSPLYQIGGPRSIQFALKLMF